MKERKKERKAREREHYVRVSNHATEVEPNRIRKEKYSVEVTEHDSIHTPMVIEAGLGTMGGRGRGCEKRGRGIDR